jgi:hypothetical protein|tara:strand:+ start:692 stop:1018 length:327 start_codon:yes stop_codon:yes gene_type:complete
MARKTEYVAVFGCLCEQGNDVDGDRNKRQADKEIAEAMLHLKNNSHDGDNMLIAIRKYIWVGEDGWFELWSDDNYWVSPALALAQCPLCKHDTHESWEPTDADELGYQ